jgi:sialate O-acetylesterase
MTKKYPFLLLMVVTVSVLSVDAKVRVASIFSSNMVLQRDIPVPVWGWASPEETVSVDFNTQRLSTTADSTGKWRAAFSPMAAGGPFSMTVKGSNTVRFDNVMIGEVWIASGQSNMSFELGRTVNAKKDVAEAVNPLIRLFTVKRVVSETLQTDCSGSWKVCSPDAAEDFSAVAYFFGKALQESLNVPVGLLHDSWSGTGAEGWMPRSLLEGDSEFVPIMTRWNRDVAEYPNALQEWEKTKTAVLEQWTADSIAAVSKGTMVPRKPAAPRGPGHRDTPSGQYNGMLFPIVPYAMRGVIWYQGEANASRAYQYRRLFPALIGEWRRLWGQGDFPFYYVQLPNLRRQPEPSKSGWAELRESQRMTLSLPNTGMAVTIDVGDPKDLHPTNKRPVGARLALIALARTYGRNVEYSGPVVNTVTVGEKNIRIKFDHASGGLVASNGSVVTGFTIAGSDKKFVPALAKIDGNTVVVSNAAVRDPVSVRYGWADDPTCNVYNKSGLPASPFRTDDWNEVTFGKK